MLNEITIAEEDGEDLVRSVCVSVEGEFQGGNILLAVESSQFVGSGDDLGKRIILFS